MVLGNCCWNHFFIVLPGLHCFGQKHLAKTDSMHENARFSPFLTQIVSGNFCQNPFFDFSHFWMTTIFIVFFLPFPFFFLFLFLQHTKETNTSFLTSPIFCKKKTLFWHNVTLFVFLNMLPKHFKHWGKQWKLGPVINTRLGPVFNTKNPKSWTSF